MHQEQQAKEFIKDYGVICAVILFILALAILKFV